MAERAHPEDPGFKDKWFGLRKNIYKQNLYKRYKFCNKYIRGKIVLDIPCGVGWGTSILKKAKKTYGVDIAHEAIDYAKKHFSKKDIHYKIGDMKDIPFNNDSFDVVICLEGFEHVDKNIGLSFIGEAKRVLKKNGLIVMTTPIITNGKHTDNPYHLYEPSLEEIQVILKSNFKTILFEIFKGPENKVVKFVGMNK